MVNFKTHGADHSGNLCYQDTNSSCTYTPQDFIELLKQLDQIYNKDKYPKQILINPNQCYHKAFMDKVKTYLDANPTSFSVAYFSMIKNDINGNDSILTPFSNSSVRINLKNITGVLVHSNYEEGYKQRELLLNKLELDKKNLTTLKDYEIFLEFVYNLFSPFPDETKKFKLHTFPGSKENDSFLLKEFHIPTKLELTYDLGKYHSFGKKEDRDNALPTYNTKPEVRVVANPRRERQLALSEVHIHNYLNNNQNLIGRLTKAEKVENPGTENEIRTEIPKKDWGNYYTFNPDGNINFNITDFSLTFKLTED